MAEPLSVTLTVIALATAVKDLVEVAREIHDAFSKLPANFRRAKNLIEEVQIILEGISSTLGADLEKLDGNAHESLKESLNELKSKMLNVQKRCAALLPPSGVKTRRMKVRIAVATFWNRDKIEALIVELKEQVNKYVGLFKLLSNTRTEIAAMKLQGALNRSSQPSAMKFQSIVAHNAPLFDSSFFSFSQSAPITTTPSNPVAVPVESLSKAFLSREFDILVQSVETLSRDWFLKHPDDLAVDPFKTSFFLQVLPKSDSIGQREALIFLYQARDIIDAPKSSWVNELDRILLILAAIFGYLSMNKESITARELRVKLWSSVSTACPGIDATVSAHLVSALTSLSKGYSDFGDPEESHKASQRALTIINDNPEIATPETVHTLFCRNMAIESINASDPAVSLSMAADGVAHMESALAILGPLEMILSLLDDDVFAEAVGSLVQNAATHDYIYAYAQMLSLTFSSAQVRSSLFMEARRSAKRALVIFHRLLDIYPESMFLLHAISQTLVHLSHPKLSELSTLDEDLDLAQENEEILTRLVHIDPQRYVLSLFSSLLTKRSILLAQGKTRQAHGTHERMLGLGSMAADSDLTDLTDLKIPSETLADYHMKTAEYYSYACKDTQAGIYAAQRAIAQYSALEEYIPGRNPVKRFKASVFLCKNYVWMKQFDNCIELSFQTLDILDKSTLIRPTDDSIIDSHMELLDRMMEALDQSFDTRVLDWARDVNRRIQKLFTSAKESGRRIEIQDAVAPNRYVSILKKNGQLEEAALHLQKSLSSWNDTYGKVLRVSIIGISYLQCLVALPNFLKAKGEIEKALYYSQEAMDIAEKYLKQGYTVLQVPAYTSLTSTHIFLLCDAGRYSEAVQLSELVVDYVRQNERSPHTAHCFLIQALCARTLCLLFSCQPQDAITTATESLSLIKQALDAPEVTCITRASQYTLLYMSFLNLADGLADLGDTENALLNLGEAREALRKHEIASSEDVGSDVHSYQVLARKEAYILFANGEYEKAADIISKFIAIERERMQTGKSLKPSLITTLQFAGVLYCTFGRHEDGRAAALEIAELKQSIAPNSALEQLVHVEEQNMVNRGKWDIVEKAKNGLTCGHQNSTIWPSSYEMEIPPVKQACASMKPPFGFQFALSSYRTIIIYSSLFLCFAVLFSSFLS